ncbi:MAG TPA: molybdopterin-binding protein [Candidatus Limnocylindrales bacterium]|nr:molybdopterin-binding protein [Candidatus Limnocylindrales bacterium]
MTSSTTSPTGRSDRAHARRLERAELLAVGSELTTGETRDTNAGDLARSLSEHGLRVTRLIELPDEQTTVADAVRDALGRADLVVVTGGLGPTPDDLTRESIGAALGETPSVDPALERWVRGLWQRRRLPFPESNIKQAWLIPSASAIPNDHGTAPGWWVDAPDGRVIVALPGPPREMHAMWEVGVLPRLRRRAFGRPRVTRTFRLTGIGESQAADAIGRDLLAAEHPLVATYARPDSVDVRVTAFADDDDTARRIVESAVATIEAAVGEHVWAEGSATWADVVEAELSRTGRRLRIDETGTNGALVALLGGVGRLVGAAVRPLGSTAATTPIDTFEASAVGRDVVNVALTAGATGEGGDLAVSLLIRGDGITVDELGVAFLRDDQGRARAAVFASWALVRALRGLPDALRD